LAELGTIAKFNEAVWRGMIGDKSLAIRKHVVSGTRIGAAVDILCDGLGDERFVGLKSVGGDGSDGCGDMPGSTTSSFSSNGVRSKVSISFSFFCCRLVGIRDIGHIGPVMDKLMVIFGVRLYFITIKVLATKAIVVIVGETRRRNGRRWLREF
jgi:hypothetical protein